MTKLTKYEINEPAYPINCCSGLSKLEVLASEQCAAIISQPDFDGEASYETIAALAVEVAKVLLLKCKEETR